MRLAVVSFFLVLGWSICGVAAETTANKIGDFSLPDFRGKPVALADFKTAKFVVVAFVGTECPLAKLYGPRLEKLAADYRDKGLAVLAIDSNSQDSLAELAAYARDQKLTFPLLKDAGNAVADAFGARRTPEVFVLDAERAVRYHGRIDDQYGVGYLRPEPTKHDLKQALDELLAGKSVSVPATEPVGCLIGKAPKVDQKSEVTYAKQISRLLNNRCVECHREGQIAPFPLTSYEEAAGWAEMMVEVVEQGRMPPWHADPRFGKFTGDRHLTSDEKQLLKTWAEAGAPLGNRDDLPESPAFPPSGWNLPRVPDAVLSMKDTYRVPATGVVRYQFFLVDTKFTEDKWLTAAEVRPGNRGVVHHILVFALDRGNLAGGIDEAGRGFLAAYVPGLKPAVYPAGMAKRIPAGSQLAFQVHYTPNGTEQLDKSEIGLLFAAGDRIDHEVKTLSAVSRRLSIPPGAEHHPVEAGSKPINADFKLLAMMPHMHLRGSAFSYSAVAPGGKPETLLDVPHYDFNWQTAYRLVEPRAFPAGTRLECVAHFDNSKRNLNNPDPTKTVRWGPQTWDEMMIGYFDIAIPKSQAGKVSGDDEPSAADGKPAPSRILQLLDKNRDGFLQRGEVPERLKPLFDRLDKNRDDRLSPEEIPAALEGRP